jgi:hypothetical protein
MMGKSMDGGYLKRRFIAVVAIIQSLVLMSGASAQVGLLGPLSQPMPEEWRAPYTEFLTAAGVADISKTVSETKFGTVGRSDTAVFRIEDDSSCIYDLCLTIIGHLDSEKFMSDAMFFAGATMVRSDVTPSILGFGKAPLLEFRSELGNVYLFEMQQGWIVIPFRK